MRKRILLLGLGLCLLAAACSGKNVPEENAPKQGAKEAAASEEKKEDKTKTEPGSQENKEDASETEGDSQVSEEELSKAPKVTFTDYSQDIRDEESGVMMLSVTENCPVVTIEENEDIAQRINMVFEQQHIANQKEIEKKAEEAKDYYKTLPEDEAKSWGGYSYGMNYKVMYVSTRILSIEAEMYDWQGSGHPDTWTSSYCFDAATGNLLYLADIFKDEAKARKIVEQHILDTITKEPYKDGLLDDYESYVPDIMTENTFYLAEEGVVVICNPYMATANDTGKIEIKIPYEELKDTMNKKYIINIK